MSSEPEKVFSLKNYFTYLKEDRYFSSEARELHHNDITLDDWEDFIRDPNSTRFLDSTEDTPSSPPSGLAGSSGSCSHQLTPLESFISRIKRDSS